MNLQVETERSQEDSTMQDEICLPALPDLESFLILFRVEGLGFRVFGLGLEAELAAA